MGEHWKGRTFRVKRKIQNMWGLVPLGGLRFRKGHPTGKLQTFRAGAGVPRSYENAPSYDPTILGGGRFLMGEVPRYDPEEVPRVCFSSSSSLLSLQVSEGP